MYMHWFVCECVPVYSLVSKLLVMLSILICPLLVFSFICRAGFVLALGCYLPSPVCICIKCIEKKKKVIMYAEFLSLRSLIEMFAVHVHNAHTKCCRSSGGAAYKSRKDQESMLSSLQFRQLATRA